MDNKCDMQTFESLVRIAREFTNNTPDGPVVDGDTILCDIMQNVAFDETGLADEIFDIWLNSSDRQSVESLFQIFADMSFEDYVLSCIAKTTRKETSK